MSARECIGVARCPFGTDCFAEKARDKAGHADVVVTNHALLAIDAISDAAVLPEHDLLVVDEAHELVDRVTGGGDRASCRRRRWASRIARVARLVDPELAQRLEARDGDVHRRRSTTPHRAASTCSTTSWPPT